MLNKPQMKRKYLIRTEEANADDSFCGEDTVIFQNDMLKLKTTTKNLHQRLRTQNADVINIYHKNYPSAKAEKMIGLQNTGAHRYLGKKIKHSFILDNSSHNNKSSNSLNNRYTIKDFQSSSRNHNFDFKPEEIRKNCFRNSEQKHNKSNKKNINENLKKIKEDKMTINMEQKIKQFNSTIKMSSIKPLKRNNLKNYRIINKENSLHRFENSFENLKERSMKELDFQLLEEIGSGSFGKVYLAKLMPSEQIIALKRVLLNGKFKTREKEIVSQLDSPFIVKIFGCYSSYEGANKYLNIAMDAYEMNFFQFLHQKETVQVFQLKSYIYQMFRGLLYLHSKGICHRDVKPQNMLINLKSQRLVICDFGSAKSLANNEVNISYICSRSYRAPELIFESTDYDYKIDVWSVGCILLQILNHKPMFIADCSLNHMLQVIKIFGTPTKAEVLAMNRSYNIEEYDLPMIQKKSLQQIFPSADSLLLDLINRIMTYSPSQRLSAHQALTHPYFDQIRSQESKHNLINISKYTQLFQFTNKQLYYEPNHPEKLIPSWYSQPTHNKHSEATHNKYS